MKISVVAQAVAVGSGLVLSACGPNRSSDEVASSQAAYADNAVAQSAAAVQPVAASPSDQALAFLQNLYAKDMEDDADVRSLYYDSEMVKLWKRYDHEQQLTGDEGSINSDPFCDCQDDTGTQPEITVTSATPTTAEALVLVNFGGQGAESAQTRIQFSLVNESGAWKIHDVSTGHLPSLREALIKSAP